MRGKINTIPLTWGLESQIHWETEVDGSHLGLGQRGNWEVSV